MSVYHIDRAARAIHNACPTSPALALEVARALDAADLLATKEAEVWEKGYLMGYRDSDLGRYAHYTRNPYIAGDNDG